MEQTIKNIIEEFNEVNKYGFGLTIDKKDKRYSKVFTISLNKLNNILKEKGLFAEKDLADPQEIQDTELHISKLGEKTYINN